MVRGSAASVASGGSGGGALQGSSSLPRDQKRNQWGLRNNNPLHALSGLQASSSRGREGSQSVQVMQQVPSVREEEEGGVQSIEMPFELKALEICLDELATDIELSTQELEHSVKPAIDMLANSVR